MKKLIKALVIIISSLFITGFSILKINEIKNNNLFEKVNIYAQQEFELIQLPNELREKQEIYISGLGCGRDFMNGSTRCYTKRTKHYLLLNEYYEEANKVEGYLEDLGWTLKYKPTGDGLERLMAAGYLPSRSYRKKGEFPLNLILIFSKNIPQYEISISTDTID